MIVVIPDDVLTSARMSEAELKLEIAIMLFEQNKISIGKARRLAGVRYGGSRRTHFSGCGICTRIHKKCFSHR